MSTLHIAWPSPVPVSSVEPVLSKRLSTMTTGSVGHVLDVHAMDATGERLLEMGLTPGTLVRVLRRSVFGGPLVVEVRGYVLSLGNKQAHQINIAPQG
jgi:Fe2+ transport system protein FeoA